jgi:hypothetical protein
MVARPIRAKGRFGSGPCAPCEPFPESLNRIAVRHAIVRWIERFDLQAVLREISLLRTEFIYHLQVFEEARPDFDIASKLSASTTIHHILDDVLMDAIETFLKLNGGEPERSA